MSDFNFNPQLASRIKELNYEKYTEVQLETFPHILNNNNICVRTGYGAGKTASFVIPIIHHLLESDKNGVRAVIILPTRSLIYKVRKTIDMYIENTNLSYYALAKNYLEENIDLNNFDIIVTTAYSLDQHEEHIDFTNVNYLVVDEIDLITYFKQTNLLKSLIDRMTSLNQTTLFTSRFNEEIARVIDSLGDTFEQISMDMDDVNLSDLTHNLYSVSEDDQKQNILKDILNNEAMRRIVIFVENSWTKKAVIHLIKNKLQVKSRWIDCDRDEDFSEDIRLFMEGHYKILVLNGYKNQDYYLRDVNQIINYDFPENKEDYERRCNLLSTKSISYKDDAIINISLYTDHPRKEEFSNDLDITFKELSKKADDDDVVFGRVNKDRIRKIRI